MTEGFYQWTTLALLPKVWRDGEGPWALSSWAYIWGMSWPPETPQLSSRRPDGAFMSSAGWRRRSSPFQPCFLFFLFFLMEAPLGAFSLTASLPGLVKEDERHRLNGIGANCNNNNKIICASLLHLQDLYIKCRVHRADGIIKFCTHPFNGMFTLMQSGQRYRSMGRRTARRFKSFFPTAIILLNQRTWTEQTVGQGISFLVRF